MRTLALALVFMAEVALGDTRISFDRAGPLPSSWTGGITGAGVAQWDVVPDSTAPSSPNVLRQSGEATFCWAVLQDARVADGFVEVSFKAVAGKEDQAGGIVWRFQDPNNYYIVRANALEGNVVLYKTVDGKRTSLPVKGRMFGYGVDVTVPQHRWNKLRVDFTGDLFTVTYQGRVLFQVQDDTFRSAGTVGVWTKADSETLFDDFRFGANTSR
jgi:hypothetical protein